MCCNCKETTRKAWTFGCAAFAIVFAIVLGFLWPVLALKLIHTQLVLKEGSISYDNWVETPIPMYFEIFLFNWTNSDRVLEWRSEKPHFAEMGPYVFLEKHYRRNVKFNDNHTVTFNTERVYEFVPEMSTGTLDDNITNLNTIDVTVAYLTRFMPILAKDLIDFMLQARGSLMNTKTVRELLFDGYQDPVLDLVQALNASDFPAIPFDKFGWFIGRNGSEMHDGTFNMFTGEGDIKNLGMLDLWNGKNTTGLFSGQCSAVYGTTGELNPPISGREDLSVFAPDVCRTVTLKNDGNFQRFGITGRKWVGDDRVLDNGEKYPQNACYCAASPGECPDMKAGVYNASSCQFGAPAFVSFPHFYLADPSFLANVDGLSPNKSAHEFYIAMEPQTGIPLEIRAQFQINLLLMPYADLNQFENVPEMLVPMIWFRQLADLTEDLANQSKVALILPNVGVYTAYALGGIGVLLLCVGVYLTVYNRWTRSTSLDDLLIDS